jgi:hypothetical protein
MKRTSVLIMFMLLLVPAIRAVAASSTGNAPFINTWLLLGTFDNSGNKNFATDLIGEPQAQPAMGEHVAGKTWNYFDDRLFSRNQDDYQDFFSYYVVKQGQSAAAKMAYAHVYVYSPTDSEAQLRLLADYEYTAWVNGVRVASGTLPVASGWVDRGFWSSAKDGDGLTPYYGKDTVRVPVRLKAGWNRLLLKVANQAEGLFGFYARITDAAGNAVPGLTYSVNGGHGKLAVATSGLTEFTTPNLPVGFRGWPYVAMKVPYLDAVGKRWPEMKTYVPYWPEASPFTLHAQGGTAPYTWRLAKGKLPNGLSLRPDGTLIGTVSPAAPIGDYNLEVAVTDAAGGNAVKNLCLTVRERPNKWYEEDRLTALIHSPEDTPGGDFDGLAKLMKRQGYGIGMPISYGNGDFVFRWPSRFDPNNALGDVDGKIKTALEANGIKFGMYIGNVFGCPQFNYGQLILMLEDAIKKYHPAAFWFDWAAINNPSLDAIYSMIKSYDPNTVIVVNGMMHPIHGDWDILCIEDMSYGDYAKIWGYWPGEYNRYEFPMAYAWPKAGALETWRLMLNPAASPKELSLSGVNIKGPPDWREMLRLQITLIGMGFVANMDHSPTAGAPAGSIKTLADSVILETHRKMGDWANPPGLTPLYTSYTKVNPGPLAPAAWGYNTINQKRDAIYLHLLKNPKGKTGMPETPNLAVEIPNRAVTAVEWMNTGKTLPHTQQGNQISISLAGVTADPVDTIFKLTLASPLPETALPVPPAMEYQVPQAKPGNLASGKPAKLLSLDGTHELMPSANTGFASRGNDDDPNTAAQAAWEYPWTYQIDLENASTLSKIVVVFSEICYPTDFEVLVSADGSNWRSITREAATSGGARSYTVSAPGIRYLRVKGYKPDGPNQAGLQMGVAELEAY